MDNRVQIRNLRFEGYEELTSEEDLGESIRGVIHDFTPTTSRMRSGVELDVELLDIVPESPLKAVLLVFYAGVDGENSMVTVSNDPGGYIICQRAPYTSTLGNSHSPIQTSTSGAPIPPPPYPVSSRRCAGCDPIWRCHRPMRSRFAAVTCRRCLPSQLMCPSRGVHGPP